MKRVAATQVAKSASNAARKAQFASSRVGAAPLANNETKSKTKAAVVKKVATKKDTWNQKINRATDRAVLHVFRQAFLALDVVQTVHAHGSTASVTCTDSNNHANVFLALTTYTTPLEMNATLRQVVSFESSAHSPRVPSGEGALRERSRVLNEGSNGNLSIRTQAFTTTATNSIIVDVAVWDFERSLRWATSQCVAYTSSVKRPEVFDMDVSKAFEAVHLAMDTPHVGRVRLELYRFAAKTIVASLDVALLTGFVNATYGTSYGKG
ncbi:hypothetical protein DYB32_004836 [Aphanomyces invadans]|uniref:Uncharacterized protein n=1 Tax=Aphanomyces invadans TaxID=157072 RepID=A0A418AWE8_9STRA|nr:hypothetical protein DYB32_004836 [Aphanomyces invadans]